MYLKGLKMKIRTFSKRLNATELGLGATNDTYVAIPNEADLSTMFTNNVAITAEDVETNQVFLPPQSNIKYTQTGQNGQERISGLGEYFKLKKAKVGDQITFERHEDKNGNVKYYLNFEHRNVAVMQKGKAYVEIIGLAALEQYKINDDYWLKVNYQGKEVDLIILYKESSKKKKTSPNETDYYDLVINGKSILQDFSYQEYIEIDFKSKQLNRMITYAEHILEWRD